LREAQATGSCSNATTLPEGLPTLRRPGTTLHVRAYVEDRVCSADSVLNESYYVSLPDVPCYPPPHRVELDVEFPSSPGKTIDWEVCMPISRRASRAPSATPRSAVRAMNRSSRFVNGMRVARSESYWMGLDSIRTPDCKGLHREPIGQVG